MWKNEEKVLNYRFIIIVKSMFIFINHFEFDHENHVHGQV